MTTVVERLASGGGLAQPEVARPVAPHPHDGRMIVEYEERVHTVTRDQTFDIGRDADLCLDMNPYLHRRFLRLVHEHDIWWIINVGHGTGATVYDRQTGLQAWLGPAARLPLVFSQVDVVFTAGPCSYRLSLVNEEPRWQEGVPDADPEGDTTVGQVGWTESQKLAVVALAEPMLARDALGMVHIPSNVEAAARIGWPVKRFAKKIDNVCAKLDRLGVDGMRGGVTQHATGRRSRLVEWAISTGFVTAADLDLLDDPDVADDD